MEYSFHVHNKLAADGVTMALNSLLQTHKNTHSEDKTSTLEHYGGEPPIVVCIGSDLAIGDSLGPVTGSLLKHKTQGLNAYVYGTLSAPVTAKEIKYVRTFLKETHKNSPVIAIDAAVGAQGDIGLLRISDTPLLPGAGAKKQLGALGDLSIMGIVAEKSIGNYGLLNTTRLNLVYSMAEILAEALSTLLFSLREKRCG